MSSRLLSLLRPALTLWLPASVIFLCFATDAHALSQTRKDIEELQRNMFLMQSELSDMKAIINKLPTAEDIQQIRQNQADITAQIQELLKEVQVLMGRFEESRYFTDKFMKQTAADIDTLKIRVDSSSDLTKEEARDLIARLGALETGIASLRERLEVLEKATGALPGGEEVEAGEAGEKSPQALYDEALNSFKNNEHQKTRKMMESLIKKYPEDTLAGNAQFWIGETYYAEKAYADAILAYEDLLQKYKGHNKVPAALLKQAFSFMELGDDKAARGILRELIENHPDSEQAKTAKEKLSTLESSGAKQPAPAKSTPPPKPASTGSGTKQ